VSARLGVAVVGLGVGTEHARAYNALEGCELKWLYDLDGSRAESVSAELGAGGVADTFEQVLADPSVEAVSIASFDQAHFEQALAALGAGKHVFVEKPLCRTIGELRTIKDAWAARPGLVLASNLVLRAAPLYRWLRLERERSGLGRVYAFDGDYLYGRLSKITEGWRKDVPDYSVMLGGGVHLVDLMLWITGERPARVFAAGNRIATEGTAFGFRDFVSATFEFPSGLVGRITANFGSVHPHQHVVRVFGTEATVIHDDCGSRRYDGRDPALPPERIELAAHESSKGDLVPDFVGAILGNGASGRAQHEFDVVAACVAADSALSEGVPVEIEYV
jgi:predicted dehydrogenase